MLGMCSKEFHDKQHYQNFIVVLAHLGWRLSDQMVTVLVSRLREPGSRLGLVIVLCSWVKQFALTVSISNQEYIWILEMCQDT